jgi:hypothetical protein
MSKVFQLCFNERSNENIVKIWDKLMKEIRKDRGNRNRHMGILWIECLVFVNNRN